MISSPTGSATSVSEATNISAVGFWLLVDDREYFVPFADYPVFRAATVAQIFAVQRISPAQFHWPDLDADIEMAALARPDSFPLTFRAEQPRSWAVQ